MRYVSSSEITYGRLRTKLYIQYSVTKLHALSFDLLGPPRPLYIKADIFGTDRLLMLVIITV